MWAERPLRVCQIQRCAWVCLEGHQDVDEATHQVLGAATLPMGDAVELQSDSVFLGFENPVMVVLT